MKRAFIFLCIILFLSPISLLPQEGGTIVFGPKIQVNDPDPDSTLQNHPAVVIDDSLRIFVAWQDYRNSSDNADIYFAVSIDTGNTFTQPNVNLSKDSLSRDEYPWLAVSGDTIIVVWQRWTGGEWKIYISVSEDGGNNFTPPDTIQGVIVENDFTSGINYGSQPKICLDTKSNPGNAYLYLIWADNETGKIQICLAMSDNLGQDFTNKVIVDDNTDHVNRHPYIAVDDFGIIYCVWARGTSGSNQDPHPLIGFNKSTDGGNTFLPTDIMVTDDSSEVYRGNPSVTVKSDTITGTNIFVVWEDSRKSGGNATPDIWFSESTDGGNTFSTNLRVNWPTDTTKKYDNYRPALDIDPTGNMAVAWHSNPDSANHYGIHMCSYNDTVGNFGGSKTIYNTLTERQSGNFGNNFYPPSLKVELVDSVTNFFMVWRDLFEDPNGNIYFIRGWVVVTMADLDIDNNALDVEDNVMDFGQAPAGPAYLKKHFRIVNTDTSDNPDSLDGPSSDELVSIECPDFVLNEPGGATIDSGFVSNFPSGLGIGQSAQLELTLFIPEGTPPGDYSGTVTIVGTASDSSETVDTFTVMIKGPEPEEDLDSLKVFPNPFKPSRGDDKIYFEGLTAEATIIIYDASGAIVKELEEKDGDGLATWDPKDNASGIYYYVITNPDGEVKKGKLAIIK